MEKKKRGEGGYKESEGCWEGGEHRGVKLGQHSDLTNLCRCGGIKKKCVQRSLCSTSCSGFRHENIFQTQRN